MEKARSLLGEANSFAIVGSSLVVDCFVEGEGEREREKKKRSFRERGPERLKKKHYF